MKTISFRFKYEDKKLQDALLEDSRICSAMRRFVFNRLLEKKSKVEINAELKEKFKCNSYLRNSEIIDGSVIYLIHSRKETVKSCILVNSRNSKKD